MRVLVTGGAGFIGSHIVDALIQLNRAVRVLDNFSTGSMDNLKGAVQRSVPGQLEIIKGDLRSNIDCRYVCENVDVVLHQGALKSVPKSFLNPKEFYDVNVTGTQNLLEASVSSHVRRFVFASSSSVYGDAKKFPELETDPLSPKSPYAESKMMGENMCMSIGNDKNMDIICLRYFNVFGERQPVNDTYSAVIPKFIDKMLKGEKLPVFGTGEQSRDFTYVDNIVIANIMSAWNGRYKGQQIFNVALGQPHSLLELISILASILKVEPQIEYFPSRQGDVLKSYADISKIRRALDYRYLVDFNTGLIRTVEYIKEKNERAK